jgi:electron transfer flavoprotein alpha subunit
MHEVINKKVWVFAEQREGVFLPVVYEILSEARQIADGIAGVLGAVVLGKDMQQQALSLADYGAEEIYVCDDELFAHYQTDVYTKQLAAMIAQFTPEIVFIGATHNGRDLGPRLASRVDTGLTADCTSLDVDEDSGQLLMTRPAFGGNLMATIICPAHHPQMATVRPGVFKAEKCQALPDSCLIEIACAVDSGDRLTEIVRVVKEQAQEEDIRQANIIVSGGRGMGKAEGFALLQELADAIGGTVGASRGAVDSGWISAALQVGQTGKTVQPELYIACGISGAIQHLAGMSGARTIIAINKDKDAPIFKTAHYGLVGDVYQIIPELIKQLNHSHNKTF